MALGHDLRVHPFISGLTESQICRLESMATSVAFEADQIILEEGKRSKALYLLITGSVAIELKTTQFTVCVQSLGPHQIFGWSALLDHQDTLFQVRSRETTAVLRLDGTKLADACRSDTDLGVEVYRRVLEVVAGRVKSTEVKFAEMCGVKVGETLR